MSNDGYRAELDRARRTGGPLSARLGVVSDAFRRFLPTYDAAVERFVARLAAAGAGTAAPQVGTPLPDFVLPDSEGRLVTLAELLTLGPVVVAINRGVWCPLCRTAVAAYAEIEPAIRAAGSSFVAISPQRAAHGQRHRADAAAGFPMLSDIDLAYATQIGLTVPLGEELRQHYQAVAIDLAAIYGSSNAFLPIPATFVVASDGTIVARHVDPDPRTRMEPAAILQALARAGPATEPAASADGSGAAPAVPTS